MTPSALRVQTPCRSSSSRARCIALSFLPSALANSAGVADRAPRPRSACKQSQTNSLKVASESSSRAQRTSRPAANHPVGCSVGNEFPHSLAILLVGLATERLAPGLALAFDAVGVVQQPVEDAVGNGGIADLFVPMGHRHL